MTSPHMAGAESADALRKRIKRHKLVFVQCGALFDSCRSGILEHVGGHVITATDIFKESFPGLSEPGTLVLMDLEGFAETGLSDSCTLGQLRSKIEDLLDDGVDVCLFSRVPRIAYKTVPGSSLLEDAAPFFMDPVKQQVLTNGTAQAETNDHPPTYTVLEQALAELGLSTLASLDKAVFEDLLGPTFVDALEPREAEALRGAGILVADDNGLRLICSSLFGELRQSLANALAKAVAPQAELAEISSGIWRIERVIRREVRQAAVAKFGPTWRKQLLNGDLARKVLTRARDDAYVTAPSVASLRDPIEWLSMGELLELVRSKVFDGIGVRSAVWERFTRDILPIRNRLSHMRLVKKGDLETVGMWVRKLDTELKQAVRN